MKQHQGLLFPEMGNDRIVVDNACIFKNHTIGDGIMELELESKLIPKTAQPGQFVGIYVGDKLLTRPFTISEVYPEEEALTIRYRVIGEGTKLLSTIYKEQENIRVMGPLGNGFDIKLCKRVLIVAGGTGAAGIPFLVQSLPGEGMHADIIIGGKNINDITPWMDMVGGIVRRHDLKSEFTQYIVTEDNSAIEQDMPNIHVHTGLVTDVMKTFDLKKYGAIYTCGPTMMMKAVAEIAETQGIPCQVSLESEMGCGFGVCKSCTCKGIDGGAKSICKDGPVFYAGDVDWEYLTEKENLKKTILEFPDDNQKVLAALDNNFNLDEFLNGKPFIGASGCIGFGLEHKDMGKYFGGLSLKGITKEPRFGNPGRRLAEIPGGGIMNSIGLENPGIESFLKNILPLVKAAYEEERTKIIVNFSASTAKEFGEMARMLSVDGIDALEANLSCPNLNKKIISLDPTETGEVTRAIRENTEKPIFIKLSPDAQNIATIAEAAVAGGANAISLINTVPGFDVDPKTGRTPIYNGVAGTSGNETILRIALRKIMEVAKSVKVPIIGMGGIRTAEDVVKFAMCGANAFMLGSEFLRNPKAPEIISKQLDTFMSEFHPDKTLRDLTGIAYLNTEKTTVYGAKLKALSNQK